METRTRPSSTYRMWTVWAPSGQLVAAFPTKAECDDWMSIPDAESVVRIPRAELVVEAPRSVRS